VTVVTETLTRLGFVTTPDPSTDPCRSGPDPEGQGQLRAQREAVVAEHMRAEMAGDLDATLATFTGVPEYDIVTIPVLHRGDGEVRGLLANLLAAFPDLGLHANILRHADDAVVIEGLMTGTHRGPYAGFEPTGRTMELRAAIFFTFDGPDLLRETVYYDELTLLGQLGVLPAAVPPT
jgi:steroid delta-isomerase-like uncharacterized protein